MVVQTKKSVKFGGRNYTYQNITQLAKKIFGKLLMLHKVKQKDML